MKLEDVEAISDGVKLFALLKDAGVSLGQIKDVLSMLRRKDLAAKVDTFLAGSPTGHTQLKKGVQERGDEQGI